MNYNLWAQEMNIDLDDLQRERPWDLEQLQNARRIARKGAEYWARERLRALYQARVEPYEFTDAQLQIARRSLDAEGSV
jgi:hypothetical protein